MPVLILVEDKLCEAYEVLARKQLGLPRPDRRSVRAQKIDLEEFTKQQGWQSFAQDACKSGFDCMVVVIDQEVGWQSQGRSGKIRQVRQAFRSFCAWLASRKSTFKASLVISQTCLECWVAADLQAVVLFAAGKFNPKYSPHQSHTENHTPQQAMRTISDVIAEVDHHAGKKRPRQHEKSSNQDICDYVDIIQARSYNKSLAYFLDRVECENSGCDQPQSFESP